MICYRVVLQFILGLAILGLAILGLGGWIFGKQVFTTENTENHEGSRRKKNGASRFVPALSRGKRTI